MSGQLGRAHLVQLQGLAGPEGEDRRAGRRLIRVERQPALTADPQHRFTGIVAIDDVAARRRLGAQGEDLLLILEAQQGAGAAAVQDEDLARCTGVARNDRQTAAEDSLADRPALLGLNV